MWLSAICEVMVTQLLPTDPCLFHTMFPTAWAENKTNEAQQTPPKVSVPWLKVRGIFWAATWPRSSHLTPLHWNVVALPTGHCANACTNWLKPLNTGLELLLVPCRLQCEGKLGCSKGTELTNLRISHSRFWMQSSFLLRQRCAAIRFLLRRRTSWMNSSCSEVSLCIFIIIWKSFLGRSVIWSTGKGSFT